MTGRRLQLRSYRLAFQLERRIHRIDRFRIPVPYGLPLSAVGWWFGALVVVLLAARMPLVGSVLSLLPWPVRLVLLPAAAARLLCDLGPDERPAWERALARARWELQAQHLVASVRRRRRPTDRLSDVSIVGDEGGSRLRRATVTGGGGVLVARPGRGLARGARLELTPGDDRWLAVAHRLDLSDGSRLEIKCPPR